MEPSPEQIFTRRRIVALALIGLAVLWLGYLRLAADDEVSVPGGAKAGQLSLERCDYTTEDGTYAADCGTLVVPENRADPQSRLIAIPITRIRARSDDPAEPVFRLEGGPGGTNMEFERASRFAENRDVVLVGYRGVDGSVQLDCPEVDSALQHSADFLAEKSFRAYANGYRDCANRLSDDGVDLAGYGLVSQVDDLEAARRALGYGPIDLLSESAGTRTAMVYAWRYPQSIRRSVMIAVNPPGNFLWDPAVADEQIGRYAELCSNDTSCSKRTDDLAASMRRSEIPDRWLFLPIKDGNVRVATFLGMMESTSEAVPVAAPQVIDSWLSAAEGDESGFWLASFFADVVSPKLFVWGQYAAFARVDLDASREYFASGEDPRSNFGRAATAFAWGGGRAVSAWPAALEEAKYRRVRRSNVETLLIGGEVDLSTPPQIATKQLLPHLQNGRQVVLPGLGHSGSFWVEQPKAGSRLINTFLDSGRVDDSLYKPITVDFTPGTGLPALAKIVVGAMVAFALVAVVSLVWMWRRVHTRGRLGRRTSPLLRSLYPIVLGLGGWFGAALILLTTSWEVPLDNAWVAAISISVPIALGIAFAWAHPGQAPRTRANGFAAAGAAALLGGWLGFHATEDLVAVFTTIVGATAAANLALLVIDMLCDRQARDHLDRGGSKPVAGAREPVRVPS